MRRRPAPDPDLDPAAAQMIEHADFFGQPQRMVRRQHIDQRTETQAFGPLRDCCEKDARRRRQVERRRMVLAHMVGAKSGGIVELDQSQPVFVLLTEWIWPVVVLIEDSELHCTTRPSVSRHRRMRDLRPAGASVSELSDTTICDQVDTGTVAAVVGSQEQDGGRHFLWAADTAE